MNRSLLAVGHAQIIMATTTIHKPFKVARISTAPILPICENLNSAHQSILSGKWSIISNQGPRGPDFGSRIRLAGVLA